MIRDRRFLTAVDDDAHAAAEGRAAGARVLDKSQETPLPPHAGRDSHAREVRDHRVNVVRIEGAGIAVIGAEAELCPGAGADRLVRIVPGPASVHPGPDGHATLDL